MSGKLVSTPAGNGHTNNNDKAINGKILVYLDDGGKLLVRPERLTHIGFWDGRGKQYNEESK